MLSVGESADIGAAVRAARLAAGRTQRDVAAAAGVGRQWLVAVERGHPRAEIGLLLRVLSVLGLDLLVDDRVGADGHRTAPRLSAAETARAIRDELARDDRDFALRLLGRMVADLRATDDPDDAVALVGPPPSTGDRRWDTLIAAVVARECRHRGLGVPVWTDVAPLESWWFPDADPVLLARTMQRTPVDLRAKGIWLDANALETL